MVLLMAALASSCATDALWRATDPNERFWIDAEDITEAELQRNKIAYCKYDGDFGPGYVVEKSAARKLQDYTIRALATPVTIVVDTTVVVVAVLFRDPNAAARLLGELL